VSAEAQGIFAVEFKARISTSTTASTASRWRSRIPAAAGAQLLTAIYILRGAKFAGAVASSAIID
jgi:hypothetical protein